MPRSEGSPGPKEPGAEGSSPRRVLDPRAEDLLRRYLEELRRWGARTNLVGSTADVALEGHVSDSLAAAPYLERGSRVVDLGSGAGFPGIPLAIARPDVSLTLVEIRERRVNFLRHVVRELGLGCEVRRARLEDGPSLPFHVALARAVAPLERLLPLVGPWVGGSGEIWVWTRESSTAQPWEIVGRIPIAGRGCVVRLRAALEERGSP